MDYGGLFHAMNQWIIDVLGLALVVFFAIEVTAKVGSYTFREVIKSVRDAKGGQD